MTRNQKRRRVAALEREEEIRADRRFLGNSRALLRASFRLIYWMDSGNKEGKVFKAIRYSINGFDRAGLGLFFS